MATLESLSAAHCVRQMALVCCDCFYKAKWVVIGDAYPVPVNSDMCVTPSIRAQSVSALSLASEIRHMQIPDDHGVENAPYESRLHSEWPRYSCLQILYL